jgi:hypothetical protein
MDKVNRTIEVVNKEIQGERNRKGWFRVFVGTMIHIEHSEGLAPMVTVARATIKNDIATIYFNEKYSWMSDIQTLMRRARVDGINVVVE